MMQLFSPCWSAAALGGKQLTRRTELALLSFLFCSVQSDTDSIPTTRHRSRLLVGLALCSLGAEGHFKVDSVH